MRSLLPVWAALAALGTGVVHLGAVVGSPPAAAAALLLIGLAELAWAIAALRLARIPLPRLALLVGPLAALGSVGLALLGVAALPLLGAALLLAIGLLLLALARRVPTGRSIPSGRYLLGVLAGALVVGAVTTPALAATSAGEHARPHGEHAVLPHVADPHAH